MIKVTDADFGKIIIDFGPESGGQIYERYLSDLTNRELGTALGYKPRRAVGGYTKGVKKGRYNVSRFKMMCQSLHINPHEILSEHEARMFRYTGNRTKWVEIEESLKNAIKERICDSNDN